MQNGQYTPYFGAENPLDVSFTFSNQQTVIYILMNFALSAILLVAVNSNVHQPYGLEIKYWLIGMALILALGSLISIIGIDIERQTRLARKLHGIFKLVHYLISVSWLFYGNYLAFLDDEKCRKELPWISLVFMVTLFIGYIQLIMFGIFIIGLGTWLVTKMFGWPCRFTPATLWRE